jgi:hypothetical protein
MWRPLSVTKNLGYNNAIFFLNSYNNLKYKLTFRNFRKSNILITSVDSISVTWRPRGDIPGRFPFNLTLPAVNTSFHRMKYSVFWERLHKRWRIG